MSSALSPVPRRTRLAGALAIALPAIAAFANAIPNGFVYDDRQIVAENPAVHSLGNAWRALFSPYWPHGGGQYRPLTILAFAADWVAGRGNPALFHVVNVLWHAAACVAVWLLLLEIVPLAAAAAGAALFAVHPAHVEAVANVVGRAEPMVAVFVVLGLVAHRHDRWFAPVFFALALACKENAIVFLGLVVAHDVLLTDDARQTFSARRWLYTGYASVAALYGVVLAVVFRGMRLADPAPVWVGVSAGRRVLSMLPVVAEYVRLTIMPLQLSADYSPRVLTLAGGVTPQVALGALLLLAFVAVFAAAWRREPRLAFALAWIAIAIAPVSNVFFASGVVLAERTLYLPSVGAVLAAALLVEHLRRRSPRVAAVVPVLLVVGFAVRSWTRTPVWRSNTSLAMSVLDDHPESSVGHRMAGDVLVSIGRFAEATGEYDVAAQLFPGDASLFVPAAHCRMLAGDLPAADSLLRIAIRLDSTYFVAYDGLADVLLQRGEYAHALMAARKALALSPRYSTSRYLQGLASEGLGDRHAAMLAYRQAIEHRPDDWHPHARLAVLFDSDGDQLAADREAAQTVALSGGDPAAGQVLAAMRRGVIGP